ncbi:Holliday junction resolvase RuvX [Candidatus Saccharibacteria bacterium]|nr:Holliday junction resolvase RuvX [Candidatus Saccharibacteria bacterium]
MSKTFLALDIGEKRIGVARGDSNVKIAVPLSAIHVDGGEKNLLHKLLQQEMPAAVVVGWPRNSRGEPTAQTAYVQHVIEELAIEVPIIYQDESLTSVIAKERRGDSKQTRKSGQIDSEAASIILQDYLEETYGY